MMNDIHNAHVISWASINDAHQHRAHVGVWVGHHARQLARRPLDDGFVPAALHEYADADGLPLFWRIRLKRQSDGEKWIRPLRRIVGGSFDLKQPEFTEGCPLYLLPQLAACHDENVWVVEGESCADALMGMGLLATTSGGADSAGRADWKPLVGRAVTIWPDNDEAGLRYAKAVRDALVELGCAVSVIEVAALDLPPKGDCVDWIAAHPCATADDIAMLPKNGPSESTESGDSKVAGASPHPEESEDERIARLASLSPVAYDRCRKAEARAMGIRDATLDRMVKVARDAEAEPETPFQEPEPWPEPVDPAKLFDELVSTVQRFIVLESRQADAAALWIAFTWLTDVVEVAPLAIINAPEKACGKSQLLTLLGRLVARPLPAANSTSAFLFRAIELWEPTVLIDEADTFIRDNDELKGLVNAGHTRQNAYVGRVVGDNHEPKLFKVWGAKALAGIALEKHLPDATMSRAVIFNMRRKLPGEKVDRLRHAEPGLFDRLASMLARFADDYREVARTARPELPDALSDRAQDNWEPLLAIAGCAGEAWVQRAMAAALELSGSTEEVVSTGNELLADIQQVFESKRVPKITTTGLIRALVEDPEAAWATYNRGHELTPRQLARMLKGYGVASKNVRIDHEQAKGYDRDQFADAFSRYVSASPENSRPPVPMPGNVVNAGRDVGRNEDSGTDKVSSAVPLKPVWIKGRDGGTDNPPFLVGGGKAESVPDDAEVF
jgi:hypothetical protein